MDARSRGAGSNRRSLTGTGARRRDHTDLGSLAPQDAAGGSAKHDDQPGPENSRITLIFRSGGCLLLFSLRTRAVDSSPPLPVGAPAERGGGKSGEEKIAWLMAHGTITPKPKRIENERQTYFFQSSIGRECAFFIDGDEFVFMGHHTTYTVRE